MSRIQDDQHILYLSQLRAGISRFCSIPDDEWTHFASLLRRCNCRKGEHIAEPGEMCPDLGFILRGIFRYYYTTEDGSEVTKSFACEGMIVGPYSSQLQGQASQLSIQALEDATLFTIRFVDYIALYARHVCWQELGRKSAEELYIAKERRERQFLLLDAAARLAEFEVDFPGLASRIPQYHIAAYLGIDAATLSRIHKRQQALSRKGGA